MSYNMKYFENLLKSSKPAKKQVALYLSDAAIERIDLVIKVFSSISDSKSFSRNTLIETAVEKFLEEAGQYLQEEQGIDLEKMMQDEYLNLYDTVILSSRGRGFEETFLGEAEPACWYPCRISSERADSLRYIAVYRGQPISAITHYAKIKEIRYDPDKACKVCYFDGEAVELPKPVTLGSLDACYFIGAKYTSLESLLNADRADKLVFG